MEHAGLAGSRLYPGSWASGRPTRRARSLPLVDRPQASPPTLSIDTDLLDHTRQGDAMFKRILVPTDGSDITGKAVDKAIGLAKSVGGDVSAISVKEPFPSAISEMQPTPPQEFFDAQERIAAKRLALVTDAAKAAGVACQAHSVEALHPGKPSSTTPSATSATWW